MFTNLFGALGLPQERQLPMMTGVFDNNQNNYGILSHLILITKGLNITFNNYFCSRCVKTDMYDTFIKIPFF